MNDFVRSQFTNKQNGEIKFWQEMIGGGAAGASQVVSERWMKSFLDEADQCFSFFFHFRCLPIL